MTHTVASFGDLPIYYWNDNDEFVPISKERTNSNEGSIYEIQYTNNSENIQIVSVGLTSPSMDYAAVMICTKKDNVYTFCGIQSNEQGIYSAYKRWLPVVILEPGETMCIFGGEISGILAHGTDNSFQPVIKYGECEYYTSGNSYRYGGIHNNYSFKIVVSLKALKAQYNNGQPEKSKIFCVTEIF